MAKVLVLYKKPKSAEAFDKHYASVHIPLAKKIPGLKKYDVSAGGVGTPAGPSDIHLVATLASIRWTPSRPAWDRPKAKPRQPIWPISRTAASISIFSIPRTFEGSSALAAREPEACPAPASLPEPGISLICALRRRTC